MQVLNPSPAYRELSLLLKKIPGVRSSAKQVSPAARLTKRVLVQIFQEVCDTWTGKNLERRGWTVLAHVCRSWRAAAFDIPRLWAGYGRFSLEEERHIGLAPFGYSATLTMDLDAKWTTIHWERLVRLIFGDCDRMKSLVLTGARVCSIMQKNANKPAPELWQLMLNSRHAKHKKFRIWGSKKSPFVLPPGIFDGQLPALSHLSLTDIVVDMNSPVLSKNLAYLVLSRRNEGCPRLCSLPQFLEVLSTMKLLKRLTVEDILTEPEDEASFKQSLEQLPQVYLLQLNMLRLQIPSMQNYSGFLDKVQFHVGSTCYLDTTVSVPRIQGFQMLPRSLYIDAPAETRFENLKVCIQASRELSFCASGEAGSLKFNVVDCAAFTGLLSLCFHLRKPLSTVRSLKLDSSTSISGQSSPFAEYLPGVTDLSVDSWDQQGLMDALSRPNVFPKLARLEFNAGPGYAMHDPAEFFTMLADAMGKRLQAGLSLELAVMHKAMPCRTSEDLENIRQRSGLYTIKGLNEALAAYKQLTSCMV